LADRFRDLAQRRLVDVHDAWRSIVHGVGGQTLVDRMLSEVRSLRHEAELLDARSLAIACAELERLVGLGALHPQRIDDQLNLLVTLAVEMTGLALAEPDLEGVDVEGFASAVDAALNGSGESTPPTRPVSRPSERNPLMMGDMRHHLLLAAHLAPSSGVFPRHAVAGGRAGHGSHATALVSAADTLFIATSRLAYQGEVFQVSLAFPRLLERFEVMASVLARHVQSNPGEPEGLLVRVLMGNDRLEQLCTRIRTPVETPGSAAARPPYHVVLATPTSLLQMAVRAAFARYARERNSRITLECVKDGAACSRAMRNVSLGVAIVDAALDDGRGDAIVAELARDTRRSLGVMATGPTSDAVCRVQMAAGAEMYLPQPILLRSLFNSIDSFLEGGDV
jgi:hypothetical protein